MSPADVRVPPGSRVARRRRGPRAASACAGSASALVVGLPLGQSMRSSRAPRDPARSEAARCRARRTSHGPRWAPGRGRQREQGDLPAGCRAWTISRASTIERGSRRTCRSAAPSTRPGWTCSARPSGPSWTATSRATSSMPGLRSTVRARPANGRSADRPDLDRRDRARGRSRPGRHHRPLDRPARGGAGLAAARGRSRRSGSSPAHRGVRPRADRAPSVILAWSL